MRILSLSLFHRFVEIRTCGRQRTPDIVFWLKLVSVHGFKNSYIVEKQLHNAMQLQKEKELLLPATQIGEMWFHCLDIHTKLSQTLQLSTLQLNLLFSNAIHFTMNLQLWHLKRVLHPVKCFWCNCEKGYIYPTGRDVVRRSGKIWPMQRKSISISSANAFNAKNADILPLSIRWIHNCILLLNATMSLTHLKCFTFSVPGAV